MNTCSNLRLSWRDHPPIWLPVSQCKYIIAFLYLLSLMMISLDPNPTSHTPSTTPPPIYTGPGGQYTYIEDLLKLSSCCHHASATDSRLQAISSPLHLAQWRRCLRSHPDADFSHYILQGLEFGFHIGVQEGAQLQPSRRNMQSAREHPEIIEEYLHRETSGGRILGPYSLNTMTGIHTNQIVLMMPSTQHYVH